MCDVLLPPGVNPTAVKYIYHIIWYVSAANHHDQGVTYTIFGVCNP
jgi:hypothetical protein